VLSTIANLESDAAREGLGALILEIDRQGRDMIDSNPFVDFGGGEFGGGGSTRPWNPFKPFPTG